MMFGQKLKKLRIKHNLTQQQVGDIIGFGRSTIAGYETKGKEPSLDKLALLANYFKISADYFLDIETESIDNLQHQEEIDNTKTINCADLSEEDIQAVENYIDYLKFKNNKNK